MSRFIILFLLVIVVVILVTTYVLGALRRFFVGNVTRPQSKQNPKPKEEVLYEKDNVRVLKGEAKKPESKNK